MFPLLFHSDSLVLPTYLVVNSLAFSLAVYWIYKRAGAHGLDQNKVLDITLAGMIGSFLGSRLVHILVEQPSYYWENPGAVFRFWQGGFVFYGGALFAFITAVAFCRLKKIEWKGLADITAPVFAFGYFLGRLGCFAAGCCYGRACSLPWAVTFPEGVEAPAGIGLHPTQLYSAFWALITLGLLLFIEKKSYLTKPGQRFGLWLCLLAGGRFVIEHFRNDFRGPTILSLSVSALFSLLVLALGIKLMTEKRT